MASIHKEIHIEVAPAQVWAAIRDFGEIRRLIPQIQCEVDGNARIITFPDGRVARELLVGIDDQRRRLVYAEPDGPFITRSAAMQVVETTDGGSRLEWTNDLLPEEFASLIARNMERGLATMKQSLEAIARQKPGRAEQNAREAG